ncbi:MAG TPA: class I SAM-dependent methyltransferase [Candidatus Polarisedimenticolia bacterium]|nr:class I SAM-dependent methyltransferase [Candidatus Polarisedimenticolia bacterium]
MPSRLLDLRECADERFRSVHREMLRIDLRRQPAWFRPLLVRWARLQRMTGYDHWSRAWEYPWAIEAAALGKPPLRLLDVGGGGSPFSLYLARCGHEVHVSDPSLDRGRSVLFDAGRGLLPNLRSLAKRGLFRVAGINSLWGLPGERDSPVRYHPDPADHLGFPDRHFDRVFCLSVMEHIPHDLWAACMREFARVLRPGGRLVITLDMETREANERLYRRLVDACPLSLLGSPDFETPLKPDDQQRRHPGHGYETIGLVWSA